MTTRKEERDRLRQERLAAQQAASASERRRLLAGYAVAGLIVAAILAGLVVAVTSGDDESGPQVGGEVVPSDDLARAGIQEQTGTIDDAPPDTREGVAPPAVEQGDLELAAKAAGCDLRLDLADEGSTHIGHDAKPPDYDTNPATSGDHDETPQADGAYLAQVEAKHALHSLEHGRVAIQYSPDLPEEDQLLLKGVFDESPGGMILFPNDDMPYDVAATAWTQLIGCKSFEGGTTLDALRSFRDIYRGQGPEAVPLTVSG